MIVVRRLRQRRQIGRLADGQLSQRLVEIVQGRRGHTVGAEAEIDLVQIQLEDPVLAKDPFDAEGQNGFLGLAVDRHLVGQQEVLGYLLGDRRCAHRAAAGAVVLDVQHHRGGEADEIDARVVVEILVFGGEERLHHALGDRLYGDEDALVARILLQQPPVARMDAGHHRRLVVRQVLVVGQTPAEMVECVQHGAHAADGDDQEENEDSEQPTQQIHTLRSPAPPYQTRWAYAFPTP